jgi:hypothetical protein
MNLWLSSYLLRINVVFMAGSDSSNSLESEYLKTLF